MIHCRKPLCAALLSAVVAGAGAVAWGDEPTTQPDVSKEIQALRARIDQLEAQQKKQELKHQQEAPQRQQESALQAAQFDADRHSRLFDAEGITAGYKNKRFFIQSDDGNFVLRPWLHLQVRNSTAWRQDFKSRGRDDLENGFEIRRARFGFDGNLFGPDLTYFFNWATYRGNSNVNVFDASGHKIGTASALNGGLPVLEEAWAKYRLPDSPFYVKAGQMHDPLNHEAIIGSKYRQPEASLNTDIFANTDTFTQAATFIYDPNGAIRTEVGVTDGIRAANTNFQDFPNNGIAYDWGVAGRVEYKMFGNWKDYDQLTAYGDKQDLLVFGLGGDLSETGHSNSLTISPDVEYGSPTGLFFYGTYYGRYTSHNPGIPLGAPVSTNFGTPAVAGQNTYEYGFMGQVSYLIGKLEPYGRVEYLSLKGTPAGSFNFVQAYSAGANYYFWGHNAKFTGQLMYLPKGIPINDDSSDVLISNNHQEIVFIAQFQLLL